MWCKTNTGGKFSTFLQMIVSASFYQGCVFSALSLCFCVDKSYRNMLHKIFSLCSRLTFRGQPYQIFQGCSRVSLWFCFLESELQLLLFFFAVYGQLPCFFQKNFKCALYQVHFSFVSISVLRTTHLKKTIP